MPKRVQLQRGTGWHMPPNTRKVDRSTVFGNPFDSVKYGVDDAVNLHRAWITGAITDEQIEARYPSIVAKHLIARRRRVLGLSARVAREKPRVLVSTLASVSRGIAAGAG